MAAVSANDRGHPMRVKLSAVPSFSREQIATCAKARMLRSGDVRSDGLACFGGVIDPGGAHLYIVVGARKPRELPQFAWVNTALGDIKAMVRSTQKSFRFDMVVNHYLDAAVDRFINRFNLSALLAALLGQAANRGLTRERQARGMAALHD